MIINSFHQPSIFILLLDSLFIKKETNHEKETRNHQKSKRNIVDNFCELYMEKPIEKISIQEITNKAGYNRSTFYQYFSDIYELLTYVEDELLRYIKKGLENEQSSAKEAVNNALSCLDEEKYMLSFQALLGDYGSVRFLDRLKKEVFQDRLKLDYSKNDLLTPYLIEFQIATSFSLFRLWIQRNKDLSSEAFSQLVDTLYRTGASLYFEK